MRTSASFKKWLEMARSSKKDWIVALLIILCSFMQGAIYSVQAPFYPHEAERKGVSIVATGFVMASYEFVGIILSPIIPSTVVSQIGSKKSLQFGIFLLASSTTLFGFLNRLNDGTTFLVLSIALRILESCGACIIIISGIPLMQNAMPSAKQMAINMYITASVMGMSFGPSLGGAIYDAITDQVWNFTAPFLTLGLLLYVVVFASLILRFDNENQALQEALTAERKLGLFALLRIPTSNLFAMTVAGGAICLGFTSCTLEPFLRQTFHLNALEVGAIFTIFGLAFALSSVMWGALSVRSGKPIWVMMTGCVLMIIAFALMGPIAIIPIKPSIPLTAAAMFLFGLATGAIHPTGMVLMLEETRIRGFPQNEALVSTVTGIFLSGTQIGATIGPILAGILFQKFGFHWETAFPVILFIILLSMLLVFTYFRETPENTTVTPHIKEEIKPLLMM